MSNTILIEQLDMQLACASTTSGKILEQAKKSENTGVFFLDICLQSEMTGLILAQELRKIQPRCFIIFITSHSEMSILTFQYKVEALDFIIKDSSENIRKRIQECLLCPWSKIQRTDSDGISSCWGWYISYFQCWIEQHQ